MWSFFSKDPSKDLTNYELQEQVQLDFELQERSIWNLFNAKKKGTPASNAVPGSQQSAESMYSVFAYQSKPGNETWMPSARNAFKRMKMLRHPNILMFQDGVENEKAVFIATERVQPLLTYLKESSESNSQKENEIAWGLYQIATALNFLNNDCKLVHNNVCMSSIVVNRAGEWKLTGFEYSHLIDDSQIPQKILSSLDRYDPPEKSPINNLKTSANRNMIPTESGVDSWGLGCLIWEIFNQGLLPNTNSLQNIGNKIPNRLVNAYQNLLSSQLNKRLSPSKFLNMCRQKNSFMDNHFVDTLLFLEEIQIKDQSEKTKFFTELTEKLDDFPGQLCTFKILPQLLNAYEFGNAGSSVLAPLFKLGKVMEEAEYQKKIVPIVVKLFSSTDRATRMRLLQQMNLFVEHLSTAVINDQIFPNLCNGFSDSNPAIREGTIRSIVLLAPKLNYNNMNVELMKHFARLQGSDDQGMIRTNATVCIGKIANFINPQLRQRILLSAFPKAMRDPFPLARMSGIIAMANTDRFYTLRDVATKVLPSLCAACVDPEKDVRDEAFKTIKFFMQKLEKVSESPEQALDMEKDVTSCALELKNETSWTSWAMTGLSAKMTGYKNKNQQPSIALNTQPLGPPPSLVANSSNSSISSTDKSSPNKIQPNTTQKTPKEDSPFKNNDTKIQVTNKVEDSGTGWNLDDEEWKDLDDDEQMEPLETNNSMAYLNQSTKLNDKKSTTNSNNSNNNDWSSWTNSFDDPPFNDGNKQLTQGKNKSTNLHSELPPASSYNWSSTQNSSFGDQAKNEEDLFSSLVNGINISNKKTSPNIKAQSNSNSNASGWTNDWNDVVEEPQKSNLKRQERQQRNTEKQLENENKIKQSKPLKLGQKKDPIF